MVLGLIAALFSSGLPAPAYALRASGLEEHPSRREELINRLKTDEPSTDTKPPNPGMGEEVVGMSAAEALKVLQAHPPTGSIRVLGQWLPVGTGGYTLNRVIYREADPSPYSWAFTFTPGSVSLPLPQGAATPSGVDTSAALTISDQQLLDFVAQATRITRTTIPDPTTPPAAAGDTSFTPGPQFPTPLGGDQYAGLEEPRGGARADSWHPWKRTVTAEIKTWLAEHANPSMVTAEELRTATAQFQAAPAALIPSIMQELGYTLTTRPGAEASRSAAVWQRRSGLEETPEASRGAVETHEPAAAVYSTIYYTTDNIGQALLNAVDAASREAADRFPAAAIDLRHISISLTDFDRFQVARVPLPPRSIIVKKRGQTLQDQATLQTGGVIILNYEDLVNATTPVLTLQAVFDAVFQRLGQPGGQLDRIERDSDVLRVYL